MMKYALVLAYCFILLAADGQETQQQATEDLRSELESSEDEHDERRPKQ